MRTPGHQTSAHPRSAVWAVAVAAAAGGAHGLFSLYWAAGGDWLLGTLGHELVDTFAGRRWLLLPVAALKLGFAALPILLAASGRLGDRTWRALCWLGAVVLLVWGGVNTLTGNLVLVGVLHPDGGYDHDGMVGHAWLWDPLFLAWGVALAAALLLVPRQPRGVPARHDTATS